MLSDRERHRLHELEAKPPHQRSAAEQAEMLELRHRDSPNDMTFIRRDTTMPPDDPPPPPRPKRP